MTHTVPVFILVRTNYEHLLNSNCQERVKVTVIDVFLKVCGLY